MHSHYFISHIRSVTPTHTLLSILFTKHLDLQVARDLCICPLDTEQGILRILAPSADLFSDYYGFRFRISADNRSSRIDHPHGTLPILSSTVVLAERVQKW